MWSPCWYARRRRVIAKGFLFHLLLTMVEPGLLASIGVIICLAGFEVNGGWGHREMNKHNADLPTATVDCFT